MFDLIIKYFSFLKHVPLLPHLFDGIVRLQTMIFHREVLNHIDEIGEKVLSWENTSIGIHKYGGTQFNVGKSEIGHVHSHGLLDIRSEERRVGKECRL